MTTIGRIASGAQHVAAQYRAADASYPPDPARQKTPEARVASPQGDRVLLSGQALVASVRYEANREILTQFARAQAKSGDDNTAVMFSLEQLESDSGQAIAAMFEELGIDLADAVGIDHSADATSDRIVNASTGMFATFAQQNSELEGENLIAAFETTLRDAVDAGYGQAREMLDGLGIDDAVIALGEGTMNLVHEKFDSFFADLRAETKAA